MLCLHLFLPQLQCNVFTAILTKTKNIDKYTFKKKATGCQGELKFCLSVLLLNPKSISKLDNIHWKTFTRQHAELTVMIKMPEIHLILHRKKTSLCFWPLVKCLQACIWLVPDIGLSSVDIIFL